MLGRNQRQAAEVGIIVMEETLRDPTCPVSAIDPVLFWLQWTQLEYLPDVLRVRLRMLCLFRGCFRALQCAYISFAAALIKQCLAHAFRHQAILLYLDQGTLCARLVDALSSASPRACNVLLA